MPALNIKKSTRIEAPAEKVFDVLSNFNHWQAWSPWLIMEPEAQVKIAEDAKSYSWEGNRVGSGNMKITSEKANQSIDYDLMFLKPWKSKAKVRFELNQNGDATEVTWSMESSLPFFLFWMKKMMEGFVGMDYERGLGMLKELIEEGKVHSKLNFEGQSSYKGCQYVGVRTTCPMGEIGEAMKRDFGKLESYVSQHEDNVFGPALSVYHKWDITKKQVSYTSAIPVKEIPETLSEGLISGSIPSTEIYTIIHTGPYTHLGNAWSTLYNMKQNKEIKVNKSIDPFEIYVNDPTKVDAKELITAVNFPLQ